MSYGDAAAFIDHSPAFVERVRDLGDGSGSTRTPGAGISVARRGCRISPTHRTCANASTWRSTRSGARFGHPPELLRYGDGFLSEDLVDAADRAGIAYDLTIEPGQPGAAGSRDARR